jgi:glycopeptide antibiotics resistance protein
LALLLLLLVIFAYFLDWEIRMWTTGKQPYRPRLRLLLVFVALFTHIAVVLSIGNTLRPLLTSGWTSNVLMFFPLSFLFLMVAVLRDDQFQQLAQHLRANPEP